MTLQEALGILTAIFFINWGIATIVFGRVSLKYLDKALKENDVPLPLWDGLGLRLNFYSFALISKWFAKSPLVPGELIRKLARPKDGYLALFYTLSAWMFFAVSVAFFCVAKF